VVDALAEAVLSTLKDGNNKVYKKQLQLLVAKIVASETGDGDMNTDSDSETGDGDMNTDSDSGSDGDMDTDRFDADSEGPNWSELTRMVGTMTMSKECTNKIYSDIRMCINSHYATRKLRSDHKKLMQQYDNMLKTNRLSYLFAIAQFISNDTRTREDHRSLKRRLEDAKEAFDSVTKNPTKNFQSSERYIQRRTRLLVDPVTKSLERAWKALPLPKAPVFPVIVNTGTWTKYKIVFDVDTLADEVVMQFIHNYQQSGNGIRNVKITKWFGEIWYTSNAESQGQDPSASLESLGKMSGDRITEFADRIEAVLRSKERKLEPQIDGESAPAYDRLKPLNKDIRDLITNMTATGHISHLLEIGRIMRQ
jgi:hypothetical protein